MYFRAWRWLLVITRCDGSAIPSAEDFLENVNLNVTILHLLGGDHVLEEKKEPVPSGTGLLRLSSGAW